MYTPPQTSPVRGLVVSGFRERQDYYGFTTAFRWATCVLLRGWDDEPFIIFQPKRQFDVEVHLKFCSGPGILQKQPQAPCYMGCMGYLFL